ncbi:hypothetical protein CEUSTIGMA_g3293.t1 [Chlamydomonas eustigma]|uniref:Uncharacterized protein n=1 Tax=Chlamydomonas eustigma TaxID=1157962 RepID=A0A250WZB7_9CHLO|nr:hypothetical protein CEUSTIGMA_g3293.t1 [Chlamydomonas eustigma]|eukprot:GAX75850.1 hypothetical protein CEUSTIGMA_g3293.t1 [Chlamydomonas eustigma]
MRSAWILLMSRICRMPTMSLYVLLLGFLCFEVILLEHSTPKAAAAKLSQDFTNLISVAGSHINAHAKPSKPSSANDEEVDEGVEEHDSAFLDYSQLQRSRSSSSSKADHIHSRNDSSLHDPTLQQQQADRILVDMPPHLNK